MRQLKGGKTKETRKEKQERKKEIAMIERQIRTLVIPTLLSLIILLIFYVIMKSRPIATLEE